MREAARRARVPRATKHVLRYDERAHIIRESRRGSSARECPRVRRAFMRVSAHARRGSNMRDAMPRYANRARRESVEEAREQH